MSWKYGTIIRRRSGSGFMHDSEPAISMVIGPEKGTRGRSDWWHAVGIWPDWNRRKSAIDSDTVWEKIDD
jgi:hypothetical protein